MSPGLIFKTVLLLIASNFLIGIDVQVSKKADNKKVVSVSITPFQIVMTLLLQAVMLAVLHVDVHTSPGKDAGKSRVLPVDRYLQRGV